MPIIFTWSAEIDGIVRKITYDVEQGILAFFKATMKSKFGMFKSFFVLY